MKEQGFKNIVVARVVDAFGIKGQVKVRSFTEPPDNLLNFQVLEFRHKKYGDCTCEVTKFVPHGNLYLLSLEGVENRDQALRLKSCQICIDSSQLPNLPSGEFYWSELIGLSVISINGVEFGKVKNLLETGANDVLVVSGDRERLIPYIPEVVHCVDVAGGKVSVDWDPDF